MPPDLDPTGGSGFPAYPNWLYISKTPTEYLRHKVDVTWPWHNRWPGFLLVPRHTSTSEFENGAMSLDPRPACDLGFFFGPIRTRKRRPESTGVPPDTDIHSRFKWSARNCHGCISTMGDYELLDADDKQVGRVGKVLSKLVSLVLVS